MDYIVDRAKERSTWVGVIGVLSALGIGIEPALADAIIAVGTGLAGLIGIFTRG
jgi:hypothetical protein